MSPKESLTTVQMHPQGSDQNQQGPIQGLYARMEEARNPFLMRARDCSKLTLPTLIPPEGHSGSTKYYTPFQSVGAQGVNNLAAKLMMALLPPNAPFFRLAVDPFKLQSEIDKLGGSTEGAAFKTELEKGLSKIEAAVQTEVETTSLRTDAFEGLKHLIVGGNTLVEIDDDDSNVSRVFPLSSYVVQRDSSGNVLLIITKETVNPTVLSEDTQNLIAAASDGDTSFNPHAEVDLYTQIKRVDKKCHVTQEVKGIPIPESKSVVDWEKCRWVPLRWSKISGEDYGRSMVDDYYGDLRSLEALSQALVEGAAAAAKVLFMVRPNGTTSVKDMAKAPNGAIIPGHKDDVSTLQMEKFNDFRVAAERADTIEARLNAAFLMNRSVTRQAERVTAEEIRFLAQELESALGGVYSVLSQEFQLPLVTLLMSRMQKQKRLPKLPKGGLIRPAVVTGVEALGRGNDLTKLDLFLAGAQQTIGPETIMQYLNVGDYLTRRATSLGITTEGLIKTEEEVQQAQAQAQQAALAAQVAPNVVNQGGQMMKEQMMMAGQQPEA